jgi:hypothetical protein
VAANYQQLATKLNKTTLNHALQALQHCAVRFLTRGLRLLATNAQRVSDTYIPCRVGQRQLVGSRLCHVLQSSSPVMIKLIRS